MKKELEQRTGNEYIKVVISLDDDCKNGHEDFSITGSYLLFKNGKKIEEVGGCIHEIILQHFPQLKFLVDLHLADFKGVPMYAVANGYYHLQKETMDEKEYIAYFRLTKEIYDIIKVATSQKHFEYLLHQTNIFEIWEQQANEGIKWLESQTGEVFTPKGKCRYNELKEDIKKEFDSKSLEQLQQEKKNQDKKIIENKRKSFILDAQKGKDKIDLELNIKLSVLDILQTTKTNFIYYSHTNNLVFNWRDWDDKFTIEEIEKFKKEFINTNNVLID